MIINYGVQWGVESSLISTRMPDIYDKIVKSREASGFKIDYGKNNVPETQLAVLRVRANSLVDRLNRNEVKPEEIEEQMKGKTSKDKKR